VRGGREYLKIRNNLEWAATLLGSSRTIFVSPLSSANGLVCRCCGDHRSGLLAAPLVSIDPYLYRFLPMTWSSSGQSHCMASSSPHAAKSSAAVAWSTSTAVFRCQNRLIRCGGLIDLQGSLSVSKSADSMARRCAGEPYLASRSAILRRLLTCRPSGGQGGLDLAVDLPRCPPLPLFTRANENLTQLLVPPRLNQILFHVRGLGGRKRI
jgi:hypothetical protein